MSSGQSDPEKPSFQHARVLDFSTAVLGCCDGERGSRGKFRATHVKLSEDCLMNALDLAEVITGSRPWASKYMRRLSEEAFDQRRFVLRHDVRHLGCKDALKFVMAFPSKRASAEFRLGCCGVIEGYYAESGVAERDAEAERETAERHAEAERETAERNAEAERKTAERHCKEGFLIVEESKSVAGCVKVYTQAIDKVPSGLTRQARAQPGVCAAFYVCVPCVDCEAVRGRVGELLSGKRVRAHYYRVEGEERQALIDALKPYVAEYEGSAGTYYQ